MMMVSNDQVIALGVGDEVLTILAPDGGSDRIDLNNLDGLGFSYLYQSPTGEIKMDKGVGKVENHGFFCRNREVQNCVLNLKIEIDGIPIFPMLEFVQDKPLDLGLVGFVGDLYWTGILRLSSKHLVPWRNLKIRRPFVDLVL